MKIKITSALLFVIYITGVASGRGVVTDIINLPTSRTIGSGILVFENGHRYFDPILHTTNVNISLIYGAFDSFDLSLAHSFRNMDLMLKAKYSFLTDDIDEKTPVSLSLYAGVGYKIDVEDVLRQGDQTSFFIQPVVGKHILNNFMNFALVPVFAYNSNFYNINSEYDFTIGIGGYVQVYIFDRISICGEMVMNIFGFAFKYMYYSAGIKYAGYRHTFSLFISNSTGYSPVEYVAGSEVLEPRPGFAFTREFDL